jgi:hypothetical protein
MIEKREKTMCGKREEEVRKTTETVKEGSRNREIGGETEKDRKRQGVGGRVMERGVQFPP